VAHRRSAGGGFAAINSFNTIWAYRRPRRRTVAVELPLSKDGQDKRIAPRYRVLGHAQIIGRTGATNCVIRDLSESGAKLGVSGRAKLPPEFDLWFVQRKLKLRVRIKWRNGDYVGVAFCDPHKAPKPPKARDEQVLLDV
jgi:hypothetical protein